MAIPDAEKLKIKTGLVIEIRKAMRALGLNQQAAAKRMGISQPKVSSMMHGDFSNLSERKLMDCLNRLGYDIEIKLRSTAKPIDGLSESSGLRYRNQAAVNSQANRPSDFGDCLIGWCTYIRVCRLPINLERVWSADVGCSWDAL